MGKRISRTHKAKEKKEERKYRSSVKKYMNRQERQWKKDKLLMRSRAKGRKWNT